MKPFLKLGILFLLPIYCTAQVDLKAGLVGDYPFSGNANDLSVNGFNGTVIDAQLAQDRFGSNNNAFSFNGSSAYIDLGDNFNSYISGSDKKFTFSAWIYPAQAMNNTVILAKAADAACGEDQRQFFFRIFENRINFTFYNLLTNKAVFYATGMTEISEFNKWHHVLVTYDGTVTSDGIDRVAIYIDNKKETLEYYPSSPNGSLSYIRQATSHMGIGAYLNSDGDVCAAPSHFNGRIDDIKIYNRLLTADEIKALYEFDPAAIGNKASFLTCKVYPNPSHSGLFNYSLSGSEKVTRLVVTDMTGRVISSSHYINGDKNTIDLSSQPNGIYFLKVETTQSTYLARLIKQ